MTPRFLSSDQVVRLHHELMLEELQQSVLIAPEKLEAAVLRPQTSVFGEDAYPTLADKAAALLQSLEDIAAQLRVLFAPDLDER